MPKRYRIKLRVKSKQTRIVIPDLFSYQLNNLGVNYSEKGMNITFDTLNIKDSSTDVLSIKSGADSSNTKKNEVNIQFDGINTNTSVNINEFKLVFIPRDINLMYNYWNEIIQFATKYMKIQSNTNLRIETNVKNITIKIEDNKLKSFLLLQSSINGYLTMTLSLQRNVFNEMKQNINFNDGNIEINELVVKSNYTTVVNPICCLIKLTRDKVQCVTDMSFKEIGINISLFEYLVIQNITQELSQDIKKYFIEQKVESLHDLKVIKSKNIVEKGIVLNVQSPPSIFGKIQMTIPLITITISTEIENLRVFLKDIKFKAYTNFLNIENCFSVEYFNADKRKFETLLEQTKITYLWKDTCFRVRFEDIFHVNVTPSALLAITNLMQSMKLINPSNKDITEVITKANENVEIPLLQPYCLYNHSGLMMKVSVGDKDVVVKDDEKCNLPEGREVNIKFKQLKMISFYIGGLKQVLPLYLEKNDKGEVQVGDIIIERVSLREIEIKSLLSIKNLTSTTISVFMSMKGNWNYQTTKLKPNQVKYIMPQLGRIPFTFTVTPYIDAPKITEMLECHLPTKTDEIKESWQKPKNYLFGSNPVTILTVNTLIQSTTQSKDGSFIKEIKFTIEYPYTFINNLPVDIELVLIPTSLTQTEKKELKYTIEPFSSLKFAHNAERLTGTIRIGSNVNENFSIDPSMVGLKSKPFYILPRDIRTSAAELPSPLHSNFIEIEYQEHVGKPTNVIFYVKKYIQNLTLLPLSLNDTKLPTNGRLHAFSQHYDDEKLGQLQDLNNNTECVVPNKKNEIIKLGKKNVIDIILKQNVKNKLVRNTLQSIENKENVIQLKPRYVIINNCTSKLHIMTQNKKYSNYINPNNVTPIYVSGNLDIIISIEKDGEVFVSERIGLNKVYECQILLKSVSKNYILLLAKNSIKNGETKLIIDGVKNEYLRIENFTKRTIHFNQLCSNTILSCKQKTSIAFGWSQPDEQHVIKFYDSAGTTIDPIKTSKQYELHYKEEETYGKLTDSTIHSIVLLEGGTTVLRFLSNPYDKKLEFVSQYDFSLILPAFGMSILVDDIEFMYLTVFGIQCRLAQTLLYTHFEFMIDYVQLDCQDVNLIDTKPVIISPAASSWIICKDQYYFHVGCQLLRSGINEITSKTLHINKLTITLQPTEIQIDPSLLARGIEVYNIFMNVMKNKKSEEKVITLKLKPKLSETSNTNGLNDSTEAPVTSTTITRNKFNDEISYLHIILEHFVLNGIEVHATINPSKYAPPPLLSSSATTLHQLTKINAVKNVPIVIHSFTLTSGEYGFTAITNSIIKHVQHEIAWNKMKKQWASGILGFNNLRLSYENIDTSKFDIYKTPTEVFKTSQIQLPGSLIYSYKKIISHSISSGAKALEDGVVSGLTGIWQTPNTMYDMAKEKSTLLAPIGFVGGLIVGAAGVVVKPVDGIYGFVQNVTQGVQGNLHGSIAQDRIRCPWYVKCPIDNGKYNEKHSLGWSMLMECDHGKFKHAHYIDNITYINSRMLRILIFTTSGLLLCEKYEGRQPYNVFHSTYKNLQCIKYVDKAIQFDYLISNVTNTYTFGNTTKADYKEIKDTYTMNARQINESIKFDE